MVKIANFNESLEIPKGVEVKIEGNSLVTIKGPNGGPIIKNFSHARKIKISIEDNNIVFTSHFPRTNTLALAKTIINIINNLIAGVLTPYKYISKICYSHFPFSVRADKKKQILYIENFLGERAPRKAKIEENVKVEIDGDDVILIGSDKETLGQTAANLKRSCKIRKKDARIFQDGVYLYKKQIGDNIIWQIK